jgi:hypothetical protein
MTRYSFPILLALVAVGAAVHGSAVRRWDTFAPDTTVTDRMHALVVQHGDCEPADIPHDVPLKERSIATSRRYTSPGQNYVAAVSIISGVPGAVATHTPDVCYSGSGYSCLRGPVRETIDLPGGATATYLVADFERKRATGVERQRVRWMWTVDGTWDAPDLARLRYFKVPELYKLYIVTPLAAESPSADPPPVRGFVAATLSQYASAVAR